MAQVVVMPKQGNTVESCIIAAWKVKVGDHVKQDATLCEVETDKALVEVVSPADGTVLALFYETGDDVRVMTPIAVVGEAGEDISDIRSQMPQESEPAAADKASPVDTPQPATNGSALPESAPIISDGTAISPRARNLAASKSLDISGIVGTGPGGRIIERDIQAALVQRPPMTRLARDMAQGAEHMPAQGSAFGGRINAADLQAAPTLAVTDVADSEAAVQTEPLKGVRRVIADRMRASLQETAQLTLNTSADARSLLAYRQKLKHSSESLGLQRVTIGDLILFAVSRILLDFRDLNATLQDDVITRYEAVNLGFAVDTPRGLLVPVIRDAHRLSLRQIAQESKRLGEAAASGKISPDELSGGTFTVTNLGAFGIESFTPIINPPQVAILGVGSTYLKPVRGTEGVEFIDHLNLSLTIDHQVVDGAPGARFLQALQAGLADVDLLLAT